MAHRGYALRRDSDVLGRAADLVNVETRASKPSSVTARRSQREQRAQAGVARPLAIASVREREERQFGDASVGRRTEICGRAISATTDSFGAAAAFGNRLGITS